MNIFFLVKIYINTRKIIDYLIFMIKKIKKGKFVKK